VVHPVDAAAGLRAHVVARPQPAEVRALDRQLADQLGELRVIDVGAGQRPEPGDRVAEAGFGVGEQLVDRVAEERRAQDVGARPVHGGEGGHELVRGQHVHVAALHEGGVQRKGVQQPGHGRRDALGRAGPAPDPGRRGGELEQVGGGRLVQPQRPGDRGQDLRRRMPVMALLEPGVVLRADPGQQRHLAPLEAGDPAPAGLGEARLRGRGELAAGAQILAEASCLHARKPMRSALTWTYPWQG
jgi:hypothetical protein